MRSDPFLHKLELDESLEPAIDDPADEPLYVPDDSLAEIDCYVNPLDEALLREIVSTDEAAGGARHLIDEITVLPAVPRRRRGQTQRRPRRQLESLLVPVPLSRGSCPGSLRNKTRSSVMTTPPPSRSNAGKTTRRTRRKRKRREDDV
ncbi:hypothetical protein OPV22_000726 [Ensete ventricosum]|uniref:Uncharacterized protein n=1 Tax=Ensete ventricosum TaxID=4639 RepID=A0AAV8RVM6_ENSVE|nr:hypothetical protein OPV22_000726 [Ensete ventricosum]RWW68253.1 hypothetical protein BHE74_00024227 [Ensete ventricosum]